MRILREKDYDRGVTIHCDGHVNYVVYPDEPEKVYTTTGTELQGAALIKAQQFIQRTQEAK